MVTPGGLETLFILLPLETALSKCLFQCFIEHGIMSIHIEECFKNIYFTKRPNNLYLTDISLVKMSLRMRQVM